MEGAQLFRENTFIFLTEAPIILTVERMKKSERLEFFVQGLEASRASGSFEACYLGYFECFNSQRYYEAHDVLEHLWLKDGRHAPDYAYYKGLIQLAGGFVHLRLQHLYPNHPKHSRRLHPARRLFLLAEANLTPYSPWHQGLDLEQVLSLCRRMIGRLEQSEFTENPWTPNSSPVLPNPVGRKGSD